MKFIHYLITTLLFTEFSQNRLYVKMHPKSDFLEKIWTLTQNQAVPPHVQINPKVFNLPLPETQPRQRMRCQALGPHWASVAGRVIGYWHLMN